MANAKSIEVKVGILILAAVGILTAFVLIMGGVNFQPTYSINVDFDNPGGVQIGAPVKIAGVKVGSVQDIAFRGGAKNPATGERDALVRVRVGIERRHKSAVHTNAVFFVTTQGVLGEQFLAIDPGSLDQPVLEEGAVIRGLDPPRLDMLLAEGYELLHTTIRAMRENRAQISEAFDGLHDTLQGTGRFFNKNGDRLDRIAENVEKLSVETNDLLKATRAKYVDNPQIDRIMHNVEKTTASLSRDTDSLLADARETLANTKRLSAAVGSEEETARIKRTLAAVEDIANRAKVATTDAQAIVAHIKKGDGSVGNLVMSEQLYDDLQEMVRDLKHNPWKFFWKE